MQRPGVEFRVELCAEEKRVNGFRQFGDFHQAAVGRCAGENHPGFFDIGDESWTDFIAVAVAFGNFSVAIVGFFDNAGRFVGRAGKSPLFEQGRISAEPHCRAVFVFLQKFFLLWHNVNDHMRRVCIYFCRVRVFPANNIATKFNDRQLHSVAKSKIRNFIFPRIFNGHNHALNTRLAKTAGHDDAVIFFQFADFFLDQLRIPWNLSMSNEFWPPANTKKI